ncbi:hypothetical protein WJX84_008062 [Apatococcus fuscideae]|uniref:Uncharacterized protein n=1 Tax=Apatococcus fuscideae TaxID=2026836 RepID=A0AAW1STV4_9CHLO
MPSQIFFQNDLNFGFNTVLTTEGAKGLEMLRSVQSWLEKLSISAVRQRLDKRRVQQQLDLHKLYLLTTYKHSELLGHRLNDAEVQSLCDVSEKLSFEDLSSTVAGHLESQLLTSLKAINETLEAHHDPLQHARTASHKAAVEQAAAAAAAAATTAAPAKRLSGLAAAVGMPAAPSGQQQESAAGEVAATGTEHPGLSTEAMSMRELSAHVQERLGYSLDVRASSIGHRDAGDGLWLQGHASVGSLIALYPGIVYTPLHYRQAAPVAQPSAMCDVSLLLAK